MLNQPPKTYNETYNASGNEDLSTLGITTVAQLRPADIRSAAATTKDGEMARKSLSAVLTQMIKNNSDIRYAYILQPAAKGAGFQLLVDSLTYASDATLDRNRNGKVDADEKAPTPGTVYVYDLYSNAMVTTTFDTPASGLRMYMPIRDEQGNTIAILALVRSNIVMPTTFMPMH